MINIQEKNELDNMQWLQKHSELNFKHIIFKRDIDKFTEEYINYITKNYNNLKKINL